LNYDTIERVDYMDNTVKNRYFTIKKLIISKKEVDFFE